MTRYEQRKQDFENALSRLEESLEMKTSDIVIDGILHRFEFTFELSWKTIKDYLELLGIIEKTGSPREIIQSGYKQGIIKDGESWIKMMLARNSLSHIYDEETSRQIYLEIKDKFVGLFEDLKKDLNNSII